jgi:hypothetical protein
LTNTVEAGQILATHRLGTIQPLEDHWSICENSDWKSKLLERGLMTTRRKPPKRKESFAAGVGRGMRRAARTAREVARMYGTPIYVWENGKVVAKDPNDNTK